jgi:hypothetical protein
MKGGSVSQSDAIYTGDQTMVCGIVSSTTPPSTTPPSTIPPSTDRCKDYGTLIELSTQFYEAQRSGVNFITILRAAFLYKSVLHSFYLLTVLAL